MHGILTSLVIKCPFCDKYPVSVQRGQIKKHKRKGSPRTRKFDNEYICAGSLKKYHG